MNAWHDFRRERITSSKFISVIEIPKGSKNKYELDKETGMLILDRVLFTSTRYPANYGFIPRTLSLDSDPLDVLVLCQETLDPLTTVDCYPIGILNMIDNEEIDEKIIAIPFGDPSLNFCSDIKELPFHQFQEIKHFFEVYKYLENKVTLVEEIRGRTEAERVISSSIARYASHYDNMIKKT
jgi:inorganic pyrophosphatase